MYTTRIKFSVFYLSSVDVTVDVTYVMQVQCANSCEDNRSIIIIPNECKTIQTTSPNDHLPVQNDRCFDLMCNLICLTCEVLCNVVVETTKTPTAATTPVLMETLTALDVPNFNQCPLRPRIRRAS